MKRAAEVIRVICLRDRTLLYRAAPNGQLAERATTPRTQKPVQTSQPKPWATFVRLIVAEASASKARDVEFREAAQTRGPAQTLHAVVERRNEFRPREAHRLLALRSVVEVAAEEQDRPT